MRSFTGSVCTEAFVLAIGFIFLFELYFVRTRFVFGQMHNVAQVWHTKQGDSDGKC